MQKFVLFSIFMSAIFLLMDLYFLKQWTRFVRQRGWNNNFYRALWITAGVMFSYSLVLMGFRFAGTYVGFIENTWAILMTLWYLPKLVIVPVLLIKDGIGLLKKKKKEKEYAQKHTNLSNRRQFVQTAGWALAGAPFVIAANGSFRTRFNFQVREADVLIDRLPKELDGTRIVQISDIHAGSFNSGRPIGEARRIIDRLEPDMFVVTGDFVNFHPDEMEPLFSDLKKIEARHGAFGCLGNHDHYMPGEEHDKLKSIIQDTGMELLVNENRTLRIHGKDLQIAGVDNSSWNNNFADFDKAFNGLDETKPTILLCHDPTNWDKSVRRKLPADLMLSGHTHGGQVGFELFGRYYSPVRMVYRQWAGHYVEGEQHLYINRGLGTVGPSLRIAMPPEISLITLHKPDNVA